MPRKMKYYRITDDTGAKLYVRAADSVQAIYAPHIRSAEQITKDEYERRIQRDDAEAVS